MTQEVFVESSTGIFALASKPEVEKSTLVTNQQWSRPQQQLSQPVPDSKTSRGLGWRCFRWEGEEFWHRFPGEAVVQLSFQSRVIGHVNIALPKTLAAVLIRTKEGPILHMQFEQEDAYDLQDFAEFARTNAGDFCAVGSIEPYNNARDKFYELLTFLDQYSKVAGVWR